MSLIEVCKTQLELKSCRIMPICHGMIEDSREIAPADAGDMGVGPREIVGKNLRQSLQ